jgi:hypothetical protein
MPEQQQATENNRQKPPESQNPKLLWDTIFPDTISFFTFWLGLFTGVLALVAFLQLSSLNRAERISANIAQAAKESAEAARAAVKLSDKNAERQLRAYIEVEIEKIDFNSTPSTPTEVVLKTKNVGQTPARETITVSWVDLRPWPHPPGGNWSGPTGSQSYIQKHH